MADDHNPHDPDPFGGACRAAAQLISAMPGPVRHLRLESHGVLVELEWHDPAGGRGGGYPALPAIQQAPAEDADTGLSYVVAPSVGTFYRSPEPGAPPFVCEGDVIEVGQQVGILEAMKMMIPVESNHSGEVIKILPPDGSAVEYAEQLIAVSPLRVS